MVGRAHDGADCCRSGVARGAARRRPAQPAAIAVGAIALAWCGFSLIEAWNSPHGFLATAIPLLYFLAAAMLLAEKTDLAGRGPAPHGFRVALLCFGALWPRRSIPLARASSWCWHVSSPARWPRLLPLKSCARSKAPLPRRPHAAWRPPGVPSRLGRGVDTAPGRRPVFPAAAHRRCRGPAMAGFPPPPLGGLFQPPHAARNRRAEKPARGRSCTSPFQPAAGGWSEMARRPADSLRRQTVDQSRTSAALPPAAADTSLWFPPPSASRARTSPTMWNSNQPIPPRCFSPARREPGPSRPRRAPRIERSAPPCTPSAGVSAIRRTAAWKNGRNNRGRYPSPSLDPDDAARDLIAIFARSAHPGTGAPLGRRRLDRARPRTRHRNRLRTGYGYTLELPPARTVDPLAIFCLSAAAATANTSLQP